MSLIARLPAASAAETERIAARIARVARPGDIFALSGELGAGKTTFARGFVQALSDTAEDVPSPTFTLVQTYDSPSGEIWHCDLYRLARPDEALELGLEDAFAEAICLIEWPERLGALLPQRRLLLSFAFDGTARHITVDGDTSWAERLKAVVK